MPEDENIGTKELEEAVYAILETGRVAFTEFKDGFDFGDIGRIVTNQDWQEAMSNALKGMTAIPAEAKDLSTDEIMDNIMPLVVNWIRDDLLPALGVSEEAIEAAGLDTEPVDTDSDSDSE